MDAQSSWAPRDLRTARRSGIVFSASGAGMIAGLTLLVPGTAFSPLGTSAAVATSVALTGLTVILHRAPHRVPMSFWAGVPTIVVVIVLVLDLMTHDASAAGQFFFCWPVLFAAYELRPVLIAWVLAQVVAADAVIAFTLREPGAAFADVASVTVTLVISAVLLSTARDREERLVRELRRQLAQDTLTGVSTRRVLDDALTRTLATIAAEESVSLILLDIDTFKAINDELGHPGGDEVLRHAAGLLMQEFAAPCTVARLGGDEMAVLVPAGSAAETVLRAEAFRLRLERVPAVVTGVLVPTTVSAGVATGGRGTTAETLYRAADEALYEAKRAGRNCVRAAVPTAVPAARERRVHRDPAAGSVRGPATGLRPRSPSATSPS